MVEIKEVEKGSIAERLGISQGDLICSVNGYSIRDEIDLMFYESESDIKIEIQRTQEKHLFSVKKLPERRLGIRLKPFDLRRCNNSCIFCFYDQMPEGLRQTLYIKDDDYRLSFLYGNYITLTNLTESDYERIQKQRLSPLYVSVHSTNPKIRAQLLGTKSEGMDIIRPLLRLSEAGIEIHTQVVVCPGINDGEELEKTVFELSNFYPNVRTVAIVPVGLTKYRDARFPLKLLSKEECLEIIWNIFQWQDGFRKRFDVGFVYPSDEIFIKAEFAVPMKEFYDGFPQLENGVGNSRVFLDEIEKIKTEELKEIKARVVFITAQLPFPWINLLRKRLMLETSLVCDIITLKNRFFGDTITVSGLLVGRDILDAIKTYERNADFFLIPENCVNKDGLFLDNISLNDISKETKKKVFTASSKISSITKVIKRGLLL